MWPSTTIPFSSSRASRVLSVVPYEVLCHCFEREWGRLHSLLGFSVWRKSKYCLTVSYREGILSSRKGLVDPPQQRLVPDWKRTKYPWLFPPGQVHCVPGKEIGARNVFITSCFDVSGLVHGHYSCGCYQHSRLVLWGKTSRERVHPTGHSPCQFFHDLAGFADQVTGGFGSIPNHLLGWIWSFK